MSRRTSATAIFLALTLGATTGEAFAGNGALIAQLRNVQNQAKIEQHRPNAANVVLGWAGQGRMNQRAGQAISNNKATTDQQGSANLAAIAQSGQNLTATIAQSGDNNTACVIQIGRNLDTGLTQTGGQSTGLLQTRRGTREIPVELCTAAANLNRKETKRLL